MKTSALRLLESRHLPYTLHSYTAEDGLLDGLSVARKLGISPGDLYKTLLLENKNHQIFVFLIPSDQELDLKKAARFLGEKSLHLVSIGDIKPLSGYEKGGCSPLGMKKNFPTYIEGEALQKSAIFVSAGKIGLTLEISPKVLEELLPLKTFTLFFKSQEEGF